MSSVSRLLSQSIAAMAVTLCALAPAAAAYPERTITVVCAQLQKCLGEEIEKRGDILRIIKNID